MVGAWICSRTARVSCIIVPEADEKTIVVWRAHRLNFYLQVHSVYLVNKESEMKVQIKKWELEKAEYQLPYDGAKEMLLVEEIDNRGF